MYQIFISQDLDYTFKLTIYLYEIQMHCSRYVVDILLKYIWYEFDTRCVCSKTLIIPSYALQKWHTLCHIMMAILFRSLLRALVLNTKLKEAFCSVFYWWKKFSPFITLRICYIWRCIVSAKEGNDRTFLCDFDLLCKSLHLFRFKRLCFTLRIALFWKTMISFHKISWF